METIVDSNTQELHLETFPMPTVLRRFSIQTIRGIATAMAIEADLHQLRPDLPTPSTKPP